MNTHRKSAPLRATTAFLAVVMVLSLTALPASAQDSSDSRLGNITTQRYAGADRYATSLEIAKALKRDNGRTKFATIVPGRIWTDALVAPFVVPWAPVIASPQSGLLPAAIEFLDDADLSDAAIISSAKNGRPALSGAVDSQLEKLGVEPDRIHRVTGPNQYLTATAAADAFEWDPSSGRIAGLGRTAIVASGEVFADALVAGPLSAAAEVPILLTPKSYLHTATKNWLKTNDVDHVIIMGGRAALSSSVESSIESLGIDTTRIAGPTRFETATSFAKFMRAKIPACKDSSQIGLARADVPFDAFSAAPLLAQRCAPLLLTTTYKVPKSTADHVNRLRTNHKNVTLHIMGGPAAISHSAIDSYLSSNPNKKYQNRSANSQLPAIDEFFIDHDEVRDLFPACPRLDDPTDQWHPGDIEAMERNMRRFERFDAVITSGAHGNLLSTGWYTNAALRHQYGNALPNLTVQKARSRIGVSDSNHETFGGSPLEAFNLWSVGPAHNAHIEYPDSFWAGLSQRLTVTDQAPQWKAQNYVLSESQTHWHINHAGFNWPNMPYGDANYDDPAKQSAFRIAPSQAIGGSQHYLLGLTYYLLQHAPMYREPGAWGLHTLLTHVDVDCVYEQMYAICDDPITHATSPHLRHDQKGSPLGVILRNAICAQSRLYQGYDLYGLPGHPGDPTGEKPSQWPVHWRN